MEESDQARNTIPVTRNRKMRRLSLIVLTVICLLSPALRAEEGEKSNAKQLAASLKAWEKARKQCEGNYSYQVRRSSFIGTQWITTIAVRDNVYEKMISQVEQVKARGGIVIALATAGDEEIRQKADYVMTVPSAPPLLTPVLTVIPLQLLAYHLAVRRGCDVDQPRNLAKSVTVE